MTKTKKDAWKEHCPKCDAKEIFVQLVTSYSKNIKYSECTKCKHIWNKEFFQSWTHRYQSEE